MGTNEGMMNSGDEQQPEQLQRNSGDEPRSGTVSEEVMLQLSSKTFSLGQLGGNRVFIFEQKPEVLKQRRIVLSVTINLGATKNSNSKS